MSQLMTAKQVYWNYNISQKLLNKLREAENGIPYIRAANGRIFYDRNAIHAWIANHPQGSIREHKKRLPSTVRLVTPQQIADTFGLCELTLKRLRAHNKGLRFLKTQGQTYYALEDWKEHYAILQANRRSL